MVITLTKGGNKKDNSGLRVLVINVRMKLILIFSKKKLKYTFLEIFFSQGTFWKQGKRHMYNMLKCDVLKMRDCEIINQSFRYVEHSTKIIFRDN